MVLAITFVQIVELLALFVVMNVVLLAPFVLAGVLTWFEYQENQAFRRSKRGAGGT